MNECALVISLPAPVVHCMSVSELPENWGNNAKATTEGATFLMNYLGSTLLDELEEGKSYGNSMSAEAVKIIVTMVGVLV